MEESGEKKANVATLKGQRERREGSMAGKLKRERASCLSVKGRRRRSMTENAVFSMCCTECCGVTAYSIICSSLCIPLVEYKRVNHHVIHSVISNL